MYTFPALKESPELNEVYRRYGIAAHHCANIEYRLAMFLFDPMWASEDKLTEDRIEKIKQKIYQMTLGQIISHVKRYYKLDRDQEQYLTEILEKRNYLMHDFYGRYGTKMHLNETLRHMIKELNELIVFLQSASLWLDKQVTDYLSRIGLLSAVRERFNNIVGPNNPLERDSA
jgi:hypothetical protein